MAAAQPVFELIAEKYESGDQDIHWKGTILGLTPVEWAAEIGWSAGTRAQEIIKIGVSRSVVETAERVFQDRISNALQDNSKKSDDPT